MSKIKPLGDRVLIKRKEISTQKGSIFVPDSVQEKPREGEILAIGPGQADKQGNMVPLEVKIGDKVLFSSYAGTEVQDEDHLILSENDILAVIQ